MLLSEFTLNSKHYENQTLRNHEANSTKSV